MIRKTAYDTTACSGFQLRKILEGLKVAAANGWLTSLKGTNNVRMLEGGSSFANDVMPFAHPIALDAEQRHVHPPAVGDDGDNVVIVVDMRPFGKYDSSNAEFIVRNSIEYNLMKHRAALNSIWINENTNHLRDVSPLPMAIYCAWVSENIARRFALDPKEQLQLAILAGIFYNSLFTDDPHELSERDKLRVTNAITRAVRCQATDVLEVLDQVSVIADLRDFCQKAGDVTGSVRLKEMNAGLLISILGNTWFSANGAELVAVALEHPPTWLTIVLAAFSERTYKNSGIARLTERSGLRDLGKDYVRAVLRLIEHLEGN